MNKNTKSKHPKDNDKEEGEEGEEELENKNEDENEDEIVETGETDEDEAEAGEKGATDEDRDDDVQVIPASKKRYGRHSKNIEQSVSGAKRRGRPPNPNKEKVKKTKNTEDIYTTDEITDSIIPMIIHNNKLLEKIRDDHKTLLDIIIPDDTVQMNEKEKLAVQRVTAMGNFEVVQRKYQTLVDLIAFEENMSIDQKEQLAIQRAKKLKDLFC